MIREEMWKWTVAGTTEVPCRRHHHRLPRRSFVGCCGLHHSPGPSFRCSWSSWSSPCFVSSVSRHTSTVRLGVYPYIHSHCAVQTWRARIIVQSTHGLQLVYTNIFVKQRSLALRRHSVTNFCRPLHIGMVKATATRRSRRCCRASWSVCLQRPGHHQMPSAGTCFANRGFR